MISMVFGLDGIDFGNNGYVASRYYHHFWSHMLIAEPPPVTAPGKRNKTATTAKNPAPTRGRGNRINYLCIESNPFAQPKTTFNPN